MRKTKVLIIEGHEVHVSFRSPDITMVWCSKDASSGFEFKRHTFSQHSYDVIMQRNTLLVLLRRFNVESYKGVKSDQLLVQGGRVPVRQVEKQCGRALPSRHCQDRTQLEQLDVWQEARNVVQVSRHQQQTMTLTRPGHTTPRARRA